MQEFYMIAEDYFERKEYLGSISDTEIQYLISLFKKNPNFKLSSFRKDLENHLKRGEKYLQEVIPDNSELIQKYQNLTSYTGGVEVFLTALALQDQDYSKEDYPNLEKEYDEMFASSQSQYQRMYSSLLSA